MLLNLNGSDGSVFTSAIWTLDSDARHDRLQRRPERPGDAGGAAFATKSPSSAISTASRCSSTCTNLVLVHGNKASVLSCPFPREMFRFQRRNAFRVRPLMRSAPTAKLRHPDMPDTEFSLRVIDISIGGCALFLPDDVPMMNAGVVIGGVRMELDDDTKLDVNLRLQHVTSLNSEARGLRLGFEYIRPGGDTLRTLQRFIDLTQKRGKLMALN